MAHCILILQGKCPVRSVNGTTTFSVVYDWSFNCILANPMKDATDDTMVEALKKNITYVSSRGFKPDSNIMDNVASKAINNCL